MRCQSIVSWITATDWPRTKSWDISLDGHKKNFRSNNQVENSFFWIINISVTYPQAQLKGRTVTKSYGHFSDLGVEIALSQRHVGFFE